MYFKPTDNRAKINIPLGYRGTAFSVPKEERPETPRPPVPTLQAPTPHETNEPRRVEPSDEVTDSHASHENCEPLSKLPEKKCDHLSLPTENGFDAEELLILALALIVFQGGKENELALLLLALLFIK